MFNALLADDANCVDNCFAFAGITDGAFSMLSALDGNTTAINSKIENNDFFIFKVSLLSFCYSDVE